MAYTIHQEPGPPGSFIVVTGDADVTAAGDLQEAVTAAVVSGHRSVAIDLSNATLVDSRTIGVLVEWSKRLGATGGSLQVVCANPNILRLFTRIGLDRSITLVSTREDVEAGGP